ncbi:hypothetical protein J6590_001956 [Homalodisca vitripennis]|nr:hypothetical protein J6590_001956 [Homalodisca vitripennis]
MSKPLLATLHPATPPPPLPENRRNPAIMRSKSYPFQSVFMKATGASKLIDDAGHFFAFLSQVEDVTVEARGRGFRRLSAGSSMLSAGRRWSNATLTANNGLRGPQGRWDSVRPRTASPGHSSVLLAFLNKLKENH